MFVMCVPKSLLHEPVLMNTCLQYINHEKRINCSAPIVENGKIAVDIPQVKFLLLFYSFDKKRFETIYGQKNNFFFGKSRQL